MQSEWITRKDAAARLGVSVVSIDRWIKDGRLEATRLTPKCVRISVWSIENLFQQGKN